MPTGSAQTIITGLSQLSQALTVGNTSVLAMLGILLGAWAVARGIWLLASEGGSKQGSRAGWAGGIAHLVIGMFLVSEMQFLDAMQSSFMAGVAHTTLTQSSILSYDGQVGSTVAGSASGSSAATTMILIGMSQIGVIGEFAVLYGLLQLKRAFDAGGDKRLITPGIVHILFGFIAADIQDFYPVFAQLFGLPPIA